MSAGRSIVLQIIVRKRIAAALLVAVTVGAGAALADQRFLVPEQNPGGPFYARIERGLIHHTEEWAAIAFYRDPACVRAGFNLLNFFDFANIPDIFGCPLTVHGFIVVSDPSPGAAPIQAKLQGNGAVPVWFVLWSDLQAALAANSNRLTMATLSSIGSLVRGEASFFEETLHPTGGSQQTMLEINAFGVLEDGRAFDYQVTEVKGDLVHIKIAIE